MAAGEILSLLGRTNLAAAVAVVLVVALRKIVRPRFGARLAYSLWLLPMLAAAAVLAPARAVTVAAQTVPTGSELMPFFDGALPEGAPAAVAAMRPDAAPLVLALWLTGVVVAALVMTHLQRRFTAEVVKGAIGPAVVGVIAPRIVTPADFERRFSGEEQVLVLAHERAHIMRQDSRLNGLSAAIQCLCWFNPLIHLAAHLMRIDQEMACDETVVTRFPDARRAYAQALVKAQLAIRPLPLGCYWPSGTEHPLLERIAMLKLNEISASRRFAGGSALAVLCAATGFAAWASQPPQVRIVPAAAPIAAIAAVPPEAASPATRPTPAAVATPALRPSPPRAFAAEPATVAADSENLRRLAKTATPEPAPAPQARMIPIAAADPAPGALAPRSNLTDAQRETSRDYTRCQLAAVRALDDGHSSEDAIATQAKPRCEAQYQAYRQAWSAGDGAGSPDERAWNLDNGRQERARMAVHASRRATAMISDIKSCVQRVADQFSSQPFDQILDQGVQRCGGLVPFPVTPRGLETAMTEQQIHDGKEREDRMRRTMIATDLRQIVKPKPSQPE